MTKINIKHNLNTYIRLNMNILGKMYQMFTIFTFFHILINSNIRKDLDLLIYNTGYDAYLFLISEVLKYFSIGNRESLELLII